MSDYSAAIMNSVVEFFKACELLNEDGTFSVDMLPEQGIHYAFSYVPSTRMRKRYVNGGSQRQFNFTLSSNETVDQETLYNLQNSALYDTLADWVEEQNKAGNLPLMPAGMRAKEMTVTIPGHIESTNGKTARYAIQMQLVYFKEV